MFWEQRREWILERTEGDDMVKCRLMFRGSLPPDKRGTAEAKQAIRRQIHPQLRTLWETYPTLRRAVQPNKHGRRMVDKYADAYSRCGFKFVPLVTRGMSCKLDVLVLRRDEPYRVIARGDLDNLLKTLIDGLRMPQQCSELVGQTPGKDDEPFYCLLEDDDGIAEFSAVSDRLLVPPDADEPTRDVVATVTVTVTSGRGGEFSMRELYDEEESGGLIVLERDQL